MKKGSKRYAIKIDYVTEKVRLENVDNIGIQSRHLYCIFRVLKKKSERVFTFKKNSRKLMFFLPLQKREFCLFKGRYIRRRCYKKGTRKLMFLPLQKGEFGL